MKDGFGAGVGMGPSQFDSYVSSHVGDILYRPADLLAGTYTTLDDAAKANAWPTRSALAGKLVMYLITGTVELEQSATQPEKRRRVLDLSQRAARRRHARPGHPVPLRPRARPPATPATSSPMPASSHGSCSSTATPAPTFSSIDTSWYDTNHYILIMTDAQNVAPALDANNPPVADAQARVALLAAHHASVVSTDWWGAPSALAEVLPRG